MRMALRTIANDSNFFGLDQGQVAIFIVINVHGETPEVGNIKFYSV